MGCFDRVWVECPNCSLAVEFQSKSGPCSMTDYSFSEAPDVVLRGIIGDTETCEACGRELTIKIDPPKRTIHAWVE